MDRNSALRKLRHCLRLSASSNPHEAAAALRQARKLMDAHGLSETDARLGDYASAEAPTRLRQPALPAHLVRLVALVAVNFSCRAVTTRSASGSVSICFVGLRSDAEVAAYAFTVLRRQLEADATRHTKRFRVPARKAAAREAFALGWVMAVEGLFTPPAPNTEREAALSRYMAIRHGQLEPTDVRKSQTSGGRRLGHMTAGFVAGRSARLHRGLQGNDQGAEAPLLLEHGR